MSLRGQRFGHIRVAEPLGEGGMGQVYAGFDEALGRKVALKALHDEFRLDAEARERLIREARSLSKLDHPNISRIHDYIDTGDSDLLVIEYIDGRTLYDTILEKRSRAEKLRIATAICGVLVAAHRMGIVHRDLKPENVMLTRMGEVKVLDFGLARWTKKSAASSGRIAALDPATGSGPRDLHATAVGITLGTPLYMSPEQARGEDLTPASDMFSFGLLLQVLFTGREPHPDDIGVRNVMMRAARGETNPVEGVEGGVTALINRLKMLAPAERLTAAETLERLQDLADRPQRILRQAALAAVVIAMLGGAWRYTADLAEQRANAIDARNQAEQRREQAEELIQFMLGDLHRQLQPIGRLDVLDTAADRAQAYVSSLKPETMSAGQLAWSATAFQRLGDLRVSQKRVPEAISAYEQSLVLAGLAAAKEPDNLEVRFTLEEARRSVAQFRARTAPPAAPR